jgi:hypothetical protein
MSMKNRELFRGVNVGWWCFAIVNNRLAEIYFENDDKKKKTTVWTHCYVKRNEFTTKKELREIDQDTKRNRFIFRNKKYTRKEA